MKVKCIKRYSDVRLNKIIEAGTVLEVDKIRADHLIHEGVAELVKETEKAADKGKEQVIRISPSGTRGEASYFLSFSARRKRSGLLRKLNGPGVKTNRLGRKERI